MHSHSHPVLALTVEWNRIGRSSEARAAIARWATVSTDLAAFDTLADAVTACDRRYNPETSQTVLAGLVRHAAHDPLAARAALQALLPGLVALGRRANRSRRLVGPGRPFATFEDLDAELLSIAFERLRSGTGSDSPWPATKILDSVWMRIRTLSRSHHRRSEVECAQVDLPEQRAPDDRSVSEQLTRHIVEAVRAGAVRHGDAALVYSNRVLGRSMFDLARTTGRHESVLRRERSRGERALAAA